MNAEISSLSAEQAQRALLIFYDTLPALSWARGQKLSVHGWVYSLGTGLVNDLEVTISAPQDLERLG